ncbi:MAG TPA: sigma-70 family RNA polymerase sigma factor [Candidatus Sulfotelmatobacter sp.]|jgi:RNA polymerase sigma-70 factor (ECF subfamily)|nr:sigma-70 family RNA polymerase sigma factor [Candidatus Sulfotelmatobacter sp.]
MAGDDRSAARAAFQEAALAHLSSLFNFALKLTRNRERAEDLVQETYLRAYRASESFTPGTNMKAWLFQILKNAQLNVYRSAKTHPEEVPLEPDEDRWAELSGPETPESIVMNGLLDGEIQDALDAVPTEYREVVVLAILEEMSYREIADILGIPIGTVMSRLHRGRKILQAKLHDFAAKRGLLGRAVS